MNRSRVTSRSVAAGRRSAVIGVAVAIGLAGYLVAQERGSPGYNISRQSVNGGGGVRAVGGMYELSSTIGQPEAGVSMSGGYQVSAGFWFPVPAGDASDDGNVDLLDYAAFLPCSTGPDGVVPAEECQCFDVDHSGAIDLADFAVIQISYTGP